MSRSSIREEYLFQAAAQLTGEAQASLLEAACRDNPVLRARLEAMVAGELAFVGARVLEVVAIDDFDGAPGAEGVAREPDFAIRAMPDAADEFVVRDLRGRVAQVL